MPSLFSVPELEALAWPAAIVLAWLCGELVARRFPVPRVAVYALVGFALASPQTGMLPAGTPDAVLLLVDVALGLVLFELGYRFNLGWLRANPWLAVTSLAEAGATFAAVLAVARWFGVAEDAALAIAAVSMSTSPVAVMRIANDLRASGQVTERMLHLCALNSVIAVLALKGIDAWNLAENANAPLQLVWQGLGVLGMSVVAGAMAAVVVGLMMRAVQDRARGATVMFALAVVMLVTLAQSVGLSPVAATLAFGFVARSRRLAIHRTERNFGALGDMLTVLLVVFAAHTIDADAVQTGMVAGLALVGARIAAKLVTNGALAWFSGASPGKGALTGLALTPLSVFAIALIEETGGLGVGVGGAMLAPVAAMVLLLEVVGPMLTAFALFRAREAQPARA